MKLSERISEALGPGYEDAQIQVLHLFPGTEKERHNIENPDECLCSPEASIYANEDDQWDLIIVDHRWIQ